MQKSMQKGSQGRKRLTQGSGKQSRKEGIWLSPEGKISVCQIERHVMGGLFMSHYVEQKLGQAPMDSLLKVRQNQCQVSTRLVFSLEGLEKNLLQAPWVVGSTWPLVSVNLRSPFS